MGKTTESQELLKSLPKETQESIENSNEKEAIKFFKKVRKDGLKRKKF